MLGELPIRIFACSAALFVCFYGTGRIILGDARFALPHLFSRVLASAITTTLVGTLLASAGIFSLGALLAGGVAVALVLALVRRRASDPADPVLGPVRDRFGPLVFVVALAVYWPAYPTFLGASDSTAYVSSGVSLARHGTLGREDDLGPALPAQLRSQLFDSMSQVFESQGPPYRRVPGGMLLESLDAKTAWPAFFPVPAVWAATFVAAGATTGEHTDQAAPNYSPVFAALALWAFWLLARAWLEPVYAGVAVFMLGAAAPFYLVARMPLSEPIAGFFILAALALLARSPSRSRADQMLAGAALGAAVFTRIELAVVVVLAFALETFLGPNDRSAREPASRPPGALAITFVAVAALTVVPAMTIPGTWTLPLSDHLRNAWIRLVIAWGATPSPVVIGSVVAAALLGTALLARVAGWRRVVCGALVVAVLGVQVAQARFLYDRTPMWLSFFIGWSGLALAIVGGALAWQRRASLAGGPMVLAFAAIVTAILFYNPQVFPSVPWGARRYVPLLLPLFILLATYAVRRAASRSRVLAAIGLALLAVPLLQAVRPVFGRELLSGSWIALDQLDRLIPRDGSIAIDRELSSTMIGPALWLARDRNNVTVPPTGSPAARKILPELVDALAVKGPVYLVTRGAAAQSRTPLVSMDLVGRVVAEFPHLEETYDRPPRTIKRTVRPIAVYRLTKSADPRGEVRSSEPLGRMRPNASPQSEPR